MRSSAKCFDEIRGYVEELALIDCHDHSPGCGPKYLDPVQVVVSDGGYFGSDLMSASSEEDVERILDFDVSLDERWPILERAWKRCCYTGYAEVTRRVLKRFYGVEELSLAALKEMEGKLMDLSDEKVFDDILEEAKISVRLLNVWFDMGGIWHKQCEQLVGHVKSIQAGTAKLSPRGRLVIPLGQFHHVRNYDWAQKIGSAVGRNVTSLDEYVGVCKEIFEIYRKFGAVAFKNPWAYRRSLEYGNPSRAEAEGVFNRMMGDPRYEPGYPDELRPLDDYLFHEFLRVARDMDLPVQIHTGHMAGIRNDIVKTNAVLLRSVLELHRDVRFDLFHANWPYSGEILFLAKNYPNVAIDFCWANIIDPVYCQRMFKQAVSCVPHGKIHGFGADFKGHADRAWAHASIARDNIAIALADMVECEYLGIDDAKQIGYDWLFGNANEFFRLGL